MVASRKTITIDSGSGPDLKNPDLYTDKNFHRVFSQLRAEHPAYWNPEADSTGFWAISRYRDVEAVLQDSETFSAAMARGGMRIFNIQDVNGPRSKPHLLSLDPPTHTQLRHALMPLFSAERIAEMESIIYPRITKLIDRVAPLGKMEFVSSIAAPLTVSTLVELMDVPSSDTEQLRRWSNALIGEDDNEISLESRAKCVAEIDAYAARLFSERLGSGRQDFISLLANAKIDGRCIDFESFSTNLAMFIVAGGETTRHAISAGMLAFIESPEELAKLRADPLLINSAVKEVIRWTTPLMHVRRTATRDVEIGGQTIKEGDKVVVWYTSANRDQERWTEPDNFDVSRFSEKNAAPHLAFGAGPHHCLGWRLAELQLKAALQELLRRLANLRVVRPAQRLRSNFIAGIKEMHVSFTPERII
jgi:linalool 8-monooxygenase